MQRLVWQNSNGDEINLTSGNYGITNWEGFANTSLNIQSQQVPFQDGGVFLDALMEQRELSVTLAMYDGGNLETRYRMRRELVHALNPKLGEGYLIYTNDFISKRIKCVAQIPLFETHNSNDSGTPKASLSWTACDPYWEDVEESEISFDINHQPIINNTGDVPCQIQMEWFTNGIVNGKVTNLTQNQKIQYDGNLVESLKINTNSGKKSVVSQKMSYFISNIGFNLNSVVYAENKDLFVFVGDGDIILITKDLSNYKGILLNIDSLVLQGITYSESLGVFVAVGYESNNDTGIILTSSDGENWTERTAPNFEYYDIVYSNYLGLFVAVGNGIATSPDGITWTERKNHTNLINVVYSETIGIFVTNNLYSYDGITWNDSSETLMKIAVSEKLGIFVAIKSYGGSGSYGIIKTSSDGITWTERTIQDLSQWESIQTITYSETLQMFVLSSWYHSGYSNIIFSYTSTDGINWIVHTSIPDLSSGLYRINNSYYANVFGCFLYVGEGGLIYKSYDAIDWEQCIMGTGNADNLSGICYSKKLLKLVAVGEADGSSPRIINSNDGKTWNFTFANGYRVLYNIAYSEKLGIFVAIGDDGDVLTSSDGNSFPNPAIKVSPQASLYGIVYSDYLNKFVIVGTDGDTFTSVDGNNWEYHESGINAYLRSVTYSKRLNLFVAVGDSGKIVTSPDGAIWTERTSGTVNNFYGVSYSESLNIFVAVGYGGMISTSYDGITWTERESGISEDLNAVHYANALGMFMAVGNNGVVIISSNGLSWNIQTSGIKETLKGVTFADELNVFVIVGTKATILYSDFSEHENCINKLSADSNMNMNLELGNNQFRINRTSGNMTVRIKYRQKYIGV